MAAGPLAKDIGAGGDIAKWLEQAGISKKKSKECLNAVRSGQTLLVLQVPEDQAEQAVARIRGRQVPGPEPQGGHTVGGGIGESPAMIMSSKSGVTRNVRRRGSRHPDEELSGSHGSGSGINE